MKRIFVVLGLTAPLLALAAPAQADSRDDVLYGISRCGGIADDRAWLDCVYGAAQPMRAHLGLQPAPASQQKLVPPPIPGMAAPQAFGGAPAAAPVERMGFFERIITPTSEKAEPPTKMTAYSIDASGMFTVKLANGETWKQDIGDSARANWNKPAATYTVQILPSSSNYKYLKVGVQQFMVNQPR